MTEHATAVDATSATDHDSGAEEPTESWTSRRLREPLLHFLVLGAILFAAYSYLRRHDAPGEQQIVVSSGKIEHLAALFARTWQRPPTQKELEGLVDDYVREEAAYRQGIAMGLDSDDTIIRRRLRQKMDFVAEDLIELAEPSDADLASYFEQNQADFQIEPRLSFRQVYFNPERHESALDEIVRSLVTRLQHDPSIDAEEQGDRTLLEYRYQNVSKAEIHGLFGERFADSVADLEPGDWAGPLQSPYGVHAVIVDQVSPGRTPQLSEIRAAVRREWAHARRQALTDEYYEKLLSQFDVVVEWPDAMKAGAKL